MGHKVGWAVERMHDGHAVRRRIWPSGQCLYTEYDSDGEHVWLTVRQVGGVEHDLEDLIGEDWEIFSV